MNIFKAMAVKDPDQVSRAIPVIDVAPAFAGEPGGLETVAAQVREASERVGFFYVLGHGVPQALIDDAFAASREFHALPLEAKLALKLNQSNIGYLPVNESMQGPPPFTRRPGQTSTRASSSATTVEPIIPMSWPGPRCAAPTSGRPVGSGCARPWSATSRRWRGWASALCRCWLAAWPCRPGSSGRSSLTRPTSTCGSCTIHRRKSTTPSSSARARTPTTRSSPSWPARTPRAWPCACPAASGCRRPLIEGTFLVNLGNVMKRWSNDRFLSTPHGVVNDSGRDRYSIAFFYSPNINATIECLPSCTTPADPPRYAPALYGDLVRAFYSANYFHQKDHAATA